MRRREEKWTLWTGWTRRRAWMGMMGQAPPADGWIEIRGSRGRLLCRLDVGRLLLEVKPKGGAVELVDLRPLLGNYELRITNYELGAEEDNNLIDPDGGRT